MNKLVILSGVPGSGKSYFSKTLKKVQNSHVYVVSSDALRGEITGSQANMSEDALVWSMFYSLAEIYGRDKNGIVILDATNISATLRVDKTQELRKSFDKAYLIMWNIDPLIVKNQNLQREYPIPPKVLDHYIEVFELPTEKDKAFFDKIILIENSDISPAISMVTNDE